jgi:hypothetical protein
LGASSKWKGTLMLFVYADAQSIMRNIMYVRFMARILRGIDYYTMRGLGRDVRTEYIVRWTTRQALILPLCYKAVFHTGTEGYLGTVYLLDTVLEPFGELAAFGCGDASRAAVLDKPVLDSGVVASECDVGRAYFEAQPQAFEDATANQVDLWVVAKETQMPWPAAGRYGHVHRQVEAAGRFLREPVEVRSLCGFEFGLASRLLRQAAQSVHHQKMTFEPFLVASDLTKSCIWDILLYRLGIFKPRGRR